MGYDDLRWPKEVRDALSSRGWCWVEASGCWERHDGRARWRIFARPVPYIGIVYRLQRYTGRDRPVREMHLASCAEDLLVWLYPTEGS